MAKKWNEDADLVANLAGNLLSALAVFPRRMIKVDALSRQFNMPLSHIQILVTLAGGDLSIGTLSEQMGIAKPNITPLVDALCEKGYAERVRSTADRRIVNVHLTDAGSMLLAAVRAAIAEQLIEKPWPVTRSGAKELNAALASISRFSGDAE